MLESEKPSTRTTAPTMSGGSQRSSMISSMAPSSSVLWRCGAPTVVQDSGTRGRSDCPVGRFSGARQRIVTFPPECCSKDRTDGASGWAETSDAEPSARATNTRATATRIRAPFRRSRSMPRGAPPCAPPGAPLGSRAADRRAPRRQSRRAPELGRALARRP